MYRTVYETSDETLRNLTQTQIKRFWRRVNVGSPDSCWEWQGPLRKDGYAHVELYYYKVLCHRLALYLAEPYESDRQEALHSCDNRRCCNPKHLRWGNHRDNMADVVARGRQGNGYKGVTECTRGHSRKGAYMYRGYRLCSDCRVLHSACRTLRKSGRLSEKTLDRLERLGYSVQQLRKEFSIP